MRWLTFALLGALSICFQTTLAVRLELFGVRPNLVFILLVHYALHTRTSDGAIAGWILGLLTDLTSVQRFGAVSLVYCLMAALVWSLREVVFTRHPLTHFTLTLVFCALAEVLLRGFAELTAGGHPPRMDVLLPGLLTGIYTGLWAVPVHQLLLRCAAALGLEGPSQRHPTRTSNAL